MSDEVSSRMRTILAKLFHNAGIQMSPSTFILELQRQKDKFSSRSIQKMFQEIIKNDQLAAKIYKEQVINDIKAKELSPIECLKRFITSYEDRRQHRFTQGISKIDTICEDEENSMQENVLKPPTIILEKPIPHELTKTAANAEVTSTNVSDILKKIVKAATDGLSKSAQLSAIRDTLPCCATITVDPNRLYSLWYFNKMALDSLPVVTKIQNCAALPIAEQEKVIIDDLLYCFIGLPGTYVTPVFTTESENGFGPVTFKISDQIDVSLRNIVQDILPMASHYSIVQKFAQWGSHVNNQILQALSEVLQAILNDYCVSIVQLETEQSNNSLNLHKMLYLIRPNMQTLQILAEIVSKISQSDLVGASILTLLYDEITLQTGDAKSQKMLIDLTERASVPYIEMLELWILKGVIIDRYNQFFVVDHGYELVNQQSTVKENHDTARYWECRYTIQHDRIPRFLENDADIILRTGKYLNVIRQCGKQISPPSGITKLEFSPTNHAHSNFIKRAYHNASKTLLELLVNENSLMAHISSVKRYFLLQQGDLITQFMDASEDELSKNVDKVTPVRLDNLLQLIVRLSSAKHDPCLEHLHCDLFTMDLVKQMSKIHDAGSCCDGLDTCDDSAGNIDLNGLDCFVFKYNVQWPVSIVLNQWALSQYQMLFRLLFYCKHVERQLCKVWIENTGINKCSPNVKDQWRTAFSLRQRMLNAIQHLEYYMMIEVIEPNWNVFTEKMKTVQNVDDVISIHQDFLHVCLQNCMLNYPDLLRAVMNICSVCLKFCKFIETDPSAEVLSKWQKTIDAYGKEFSKFLIDLLNGINDLSAETTTGAKLVNLVCRINFNGYYTEELEQNCAKHVSPTVCAK